MDTYGKHVAKVIASKRFPYDLKKQADFIEAFRLPSEVSLNFRQQPHNGGLTPFEILDLLFDIPAARVVWARLERIEERAKEILETPGDPRIDIVKKIPPLIKDAILRIERGIDCSYDVGQIEILCNQADMVMMKPVVAKGLKFNNGPKEDRMDKLSEAMLKAWRDFVSKYDRNPKARELWDHLPTVGHVQEKEEESDGARNIAWVRPNGEQKNTPFKSFQNRYTTLKKKFNL